MKESISKINGLIVWYEKNSYKANINQLLDFQDKLAAETFYVAQELSKYHNDYINAYRIRKWTFNNEKSKFIQSKVMTGAAAEAKSHDLTIELKEAEDINYNIGYKLDLIVRSADRILKVCQQRISWLKMEYDETKKQNQT